jgi:hypothetical protein
LETRFHGIALTDHTQVQAFFHHDQRFARRSVSNILETGTPVQTLTTSAISSAAVTSVLGATFVHPHGRELYGLLVPSPC